MADYRQNVVGTILPLSVESNQCGDLRLNLLPALSEHDAFSLKEPEALVAQINSCLNSSKKRMQGLLLLDSLLQECSSEVFTCNCQTWLTLLTQAVQSHGSPVHHQYTLQVLSRLIEKVTAFPELARDFGTSKMKVLLSAVLGPNFEAPRESILACIITCILNFPGPTSLFKNKIEALVIEELDKAVATKVHMRCFALLPRCTTGGHRGDKHREAWVQLYGQLMANLNALLAQLYCGFETGEEAGEDCIFSSPAPDTQPDQTTCLVRRFNTLCSCLVALLSESFPTWIPVNIDEVLGFVSRCLAVQMDMLTKKSSTDHLLLLTFLPSLHTSAFSVLKEFIVCAKGLLIPDGEFIYRLCLQCLVSSQLKTHNSPGHMPFRSLRKKVYETLVTWFKVTGAAHGIADLKDLLSHLFADVSQQQPEALQLAKWEGSTNRHAPPAKKRKRKGKHSNYQELAVHSAAWQANNSKDTVTTALATLHQLIVSTGATLNTEALEHVQSGVCSLVQEVQACPLAPYASSSRCRYLLYTSLVAAVTLPRPLTYLLQQAFHLFQHGLRDKDIMVATVCREGLSRCQSLTNPVFPCLKKPPADDSKSKSATQTSSPAALPTRSIQSAELGGHTSQAFDAQPTSSSPVGKRIQASAATVSNSQPSPAAEKNQASVVTVSKSKPSPVAERDQASVATTSESSSSSTPQGDVERKRKRQWPEGEDSEGGSSDDEDGDSKQGVEGTGSAEAESTQNEDVDEIAHIEGRGEAETAVGKEAAAENAGCGTPQETEGGLGDAGIENKDTQQQSADVSAMLMSFAACEADPDESDMSE